ncbi:hypothetical protein NCC49_003402 [Naganishia albida]|nr:hypothetical protein NCC49_003402 [Naganishia albida]
MSRFAELPGFERELSASSSFFQTGKTVVITGGASGIGRQVAVRYVRQGARVVIGDLNVEGCRETIRECGRPSSGGQCLTPDVPCDVTSRTSTLQLFDFANDVFGSPPDIVIANAGVNEVGHLEDDVVLENELGPYPKQPRQTTLDVNLAGAILTAETARATWAQHPAERQRKLILISSMGGWEGIPGAPLYSMAKHGLMGYWVALSAELAKSGAKPFSTHAICPFFAATSILDTAVLLALAGIPKTTPEDIAAAIETIGRDNPSDSQSADSAVLLPDNKTPLMIRSQDFDPLSGDMYADLSSVLNKRQPQPGQADFKSTAVDDIKQALSHNKKARSVPLLLGAAVAVFLCNLLAKRLSVFQNLAFGFAVAAALSFFQGSTFARRQCFEIGVSRG